MDKATFVETDLQATSGGRVLYARASEKGNIVKLYKDFWKLSVSDRYALLVHELAHHTNENNALSAKASSWDTQFRTSKGLEIERNANDISMRILRVGPRVTEMPELLRNAQE